MNKGYILYHLREALESLNEMCKSIEQDDEYNQVEYYSDLSHLYQHINIAWNARDSSDQEADECSAKNYKKWVQFPKDIDMTEFLD